MKFIVTMGWNKFQLHQLRNKSDRKRSHKLSKSERAAKERNYAKREKAIDALEAYVNR